MNTVVKWLYGLVAACIGAAASGITVAIVAPESFNFSHAGLQKLAAVCGVNALLAAGAYLKQSPLPALQTVTQTTTLESNTEISPGPETK